jgi:hypothetical protein
MPAEPHISDSTKESKSDTKGGLTSLVPVVPVYQGTPQSNKPARIPVTRTKQATRLGTQQVY